ASSGTLAATPAPDWMRMVWPWALSFFAVSGVMATRVSPAVISAGTPISMGLSSSSYSFLTGSRELLLDLPRVLVQEFVPICSYLYLSGSLHAILEIFLSVRPIPYSFFEFTYSQDRPTTAY